MRNFILRHFSKFAYAEIVVGVVFGGVVFFTALSPFFYLITAYAVGDGGTSLYVSAQRAKVREEAAAQADRDYFDPGDDENDFNENAEEEFDEQYHT